MSELIKGGAQAPKEAVQVVSNPADPPPAKQRPPRVPMASVRQRLQVPDIPGYRLYWFKDENVPRALDAYYEFVKNEEIHMNHNSIASGQMVSGNTDMGTNVSLVAGQSDAGQPVRLHLMKLPMEYYLEDQKRIEQMNLQIMESIFGEEAKMFDRNNSVKEMDPLSYRKTALFNRPVRKAERKRGMQSLQSRVAQLEGLLKSKE
jgi:hypothetical protein